MKLGYAFLAFMWINACSSSNDSSSADSAATKSETTTVSNVTVKDLSTNYTYDAVSKTWFLTVTWVAEDNATNYSIKVGQESGNYTDTYKDITSPYVVKNLASGVGYYFLITYIKPVDGVATTISSSEFFVKIPDDNYTEKPGTFKITKAQEGDGQVILDWEDAPRAAYYIIKRGTSSGSYPTIVAKLAPKPYTDKNLTNGQKLYYMVIAVNSKGTTEAQSEISATPAAASSNPPPGDFNLTIVSGEARATLSWGVSSNATSYIVQYGTTSGSYTTTVSDNASSPLVVSGLNYNTTYYFQVTAVNSYGTKSTNASAFILDRWLGIKESIGSGDTQGYGITTDANSNVYVAGATDLGLDGNTLSNGASYDFFVAKYDLSGAKLWTRQNGNGGNTQATSVTSDADANVYVAGYTDVGLDGNTFTSGGDSDLFVSKYDTNGIRKWTVELGNGGETRATAIVSDAFSNIYVAGYMNIFEAGHTPSVRSELFIAKYDTNGSLLWLQKLGATGGLVPDSAATGIALDAQGFVYATGYTNVDLDGYPSPYPNYNLFVVKYDSTGLKKWTQILGNGGDTYTNAITIDNSSNIYVTGNTNVALDGNSLVSNSYDVFITKYDSDGNKQWTKEFGTTDDSSANGIAHDTAGSIYVTGRTVGSLDPTVPSSGRAQDLFVAKYDADGTKKWVRQVWGNALSDNSAAQTVANAIALDSISNVYITGATNIGLDANVFGGGSNDYFVAKFDSGGFTYDSYGIKVPSKPASFNIINALPLNSKVILSWESKIFNGSYTLYDEPTYNVLRRTDSSSYTTIATGVLSPYTDSGLTNGTTYYYMVVAVSGAESTNANSEVSATPTSSAAADNQLLPGMCLGIDEYIFNGNYSVMLQHDTNFCINGYPSLNWDNIWCSMTHQANIDHVCLTSDGQLVMTSTSGCPSGQSKVVYKADVNSANPAVRFEISSDPRISLYDALDNEIWYADQSTNSLQLNSFIPGPGVCQ